jgi:ankyrin repeat protein/predicted NAD-dependent protein-ADP-ribosyltransferase YbiA (DUF1768 family)
MLAVMKRRNPAISAELGLADDLTDTTRMDLLCGFLDLHAEPAELFRELSGEGVDLDQTDPLFADELRGRPRFVPVVECMLEHGADLLALTNSGATPLEHAVELGTPALVGLLLGRGAASREQLAGTMGVELLKQSLDRNALAIADLLVRHGANIHAMEGALDHAAFSGTRDAVDWLLQHGFEINQCGDGGSPAILSAAGNGQHATVAHLISLRADRQACDEEGSGLLHHSAPWPKCLEVVLPLRLPVDQANLKGRTPLQRAAQANEPESIRQLLQAGACASAQDHQGNTALHLIFESDEFRPDIEFPVFLALVEAGADLTLRNHAGQTAYDLAIRARYHSEYLQLLNPDGSGARPGTFLWLGSDPVLKDFLPQAEVPIEVDGVRFPSSQAWFRTLKSQPKRGGEPWSAACDDLMRNALRHKFVQHPHLRERLLGTGDSILIADSSVEGCWGGYWTEWQGTPFNALGHLLMKVREELRPGLVAS